jgi:phosphoribosylanthranilate isomerase
MTRTLVKFCGLTNESDLTAAASLGVDFIGFVFYGKSPRSITPDKAQRLRKLLPQNVQAVGLFVDQSQAEIESIHRQVKLDVLQFHGDQSLETCQRTSAVCQLAAPLKGFWKAIRIAVQSDLLPWRQLDLTDGLEPPGALLLDSFSPLFGGSGHAFDWSWIAPNAISRPAALPLIASGGLTVSNVAQAIRTIRPWAVDVSSGIQTDDPRKKSPVLMNDFLMQVRQVDSLLKDGNEVI